MAQGQSQQVGRRLCRMLEQTQDDPATDRQLLERFLQHQDEEAFGLLVRRHGPLVMSVCRALLRDGHEAEDVYQATWLVLARRLRQVAWRDSIAGWLYEVAHRLALKARAQSARRNARTGSLEEEPLAAADASDEARWLLEEVARLPEKYRDPLVLCYLEGKTNAEAARALNCPPGSMSKRLARGLQLLRDRLRGRGHGMGLASLQAALGHLGGVAVPAGWGETITSAAVALAGGKVALTALASGPVVSLVQGLVRDMTLQQFKFVGLVAVVLLLGGAGLGVLALRSASAQPRGPAAQPTRPAEEKGGLQPAEPGKVPATPARTFASGLFLNVHQIVEGQTHPRKLGTTGPVVLVNPQKKPAPVQIPANAVWYVQYTPQFGFGGGAIGAIGNPGFVQIGAAGGFAQIGVPPAQQAGVAGAAGGFIQIGAAGGFAQIGQPPAPPRQPMPPAGVAGAVGAAGGFVQIGAAGGFAQVGVPPAQPGQAGVAGVGGGFVQIGAAGGFAQIGGLGFQGMPLQGAGKLTGQELQTLLAEMKKQQAPGLRVDNLELSDDDLATVVKELPGLQVLLLNNTRTTDAGVKHLAGLKNLRVLGLVGSEFTDKAAEELLRLAPLDTLRLGGGKFTNKALSAVGEMKALRTLRLEWATIDKTGLAALAKLDTLEAVELLGESTDEDVAALKALPGLKQVRLHFSKLAGKGVEALADIDKLEQLTLDWMWGEDGPSLQTFALGNLGVGGGFGVGGAQIGFAGVAGVAGGAGAVGNLGGGPGAGAAGGLGVVGMPQGGPQVMTPPIVLLPDGTQKPKPEPALTAPDLRPLAGAKNLTSLYLMADAFGDAEAERLKGCVGLRKLELFAPNLTDQGIAHLRDLKALERLNVCVSKVTPASTASLRNLPNLKLLYVPILPLDAASRKQLATFKQALPRCNVQSLTSMPGFEMLAPFVGLGG